MAETFPKVFEIPFNSATKWHLTIHKKKHENGAYTLLIKGAPERIFRLCSTIVTKDGQVCWFIYIDCTLLIKEKIETIGDAHQKEFQTAYELMASKGHRVIGCAKFLLPDSEYPEGFSFKKEDDDVKRERAEFPDKQVGLYPKGGYTFMGLVSLEDPPKHGVREAIGQCRQAGIKVMMVTGDHPLTAEVCIILVFRL